MIPLAIVAIVRKILLSFAPLVLFYLFKKIAKEQPKRKSHLSDFDKSQVIDGEIVEEKRK